MSIRSGTLRASLCRRCATTCVASIAASIQLAQTRGLCPHESLYSKGPVSAVRVPRGPAILLGPPGQSGLVVLLMRGSLNGGSRLYTHTHGK